MMRPGCRRRCGLRGATHSADAVRLPAVDGQHVHAPEVGGIPLERLAHLQGELTRGGEDERLRLLLLEVELAEDGRANAAVLPVPVCASPTTWRPSSRAGIVAAWIGDGYS